jgi:hypothetical protein
MYICTSFERIQQTAAAFIDISRAYDNVLIDILCDILREKEELLQVVRFLFRLLWRKELEFFAGGRTFLRLVGYKSLSQGSVLSPCLYNNSAQICSSDLDLDFFNMLVIWWYIWHTDCLIWLCWTGSNCLHIVECFIFFYGHDDICFKVGGYAVY